MSILLALVTALVLMQFHRREAHPPRTGVAESPTQPTDQRQLTNHPVPFS